MSDETHTPSTDLTNGPSQPSEKESTPGSDIERIVNSVENAPESAVLEPEYVGNAKTFYDDLRKAYPEERIGQVMRQVRDALDLSVADIRAKTLHSEQKLISIERMEISDMSRGYVTPVVRDYAKALGLDGDIVVRDYTEDCGTLDTVSAPEQIVTPDVPARRLPIRAAMAAAAVLSIGLVGAAVLAMTQMGGGERGVEFAAQPLNGAAESLFSDVPMTERVRVENMELTLVALQDAWVEVRGPDGTLYRNRIMRAGETYIPRAGAGWTISARNGAAFEWRLGDAVIGLLGPEDTAVFAASVDAAATRAQDTAAPALAAAGNGQPSR